MTSRDITTRRTIPGRGGFKTITVVTKGSEMGKRGPQRKEGKRYPSGNLDRRTAGERYRDAVTAERREMLSVVLNQPHRRDCLDPESKLRDMPLGRFCEAAKCCDETYAGVVQYAIMRERRRLAVAGGPKGVGSFTSSSNADPEGPNAEQIARWEARIKEANVAVYTHCGPEPERILKYISDIAIFHRELSQVEFAEWHARIRHAMGEIAVVMGSLKENHPFKAS